MTVTYTPAEVFAPGEYLRDELEERGWTVTEFAEIIGRPVQAVSEILNGKKEITTETALALSEAFGTSPALWLNLQTNYRLFEQRTRIASSSTSLTPVARRARLRGLLPLAEVRNRGWLPATDDLDVIEDAVRRFLDVGSLDEQPRFALAARRANTTEPITLEQAAWLAHVRTVAATRTVSAFDRTKLASLALALPRVLRAGPSKLTELQPRLADCGVTLVIAEGLRGGKLDGAVTFVGNRPVIGLTTRGDRFDGLLFTLLHECAHLVLGHISPEAPAIVDDDLMDTQSDPNEVAANDQASAWLFPGGFEISSTTLPTIVSTAERYQVHPSVVLGRVQRDKQNWKLHRPHVPKVRALLAEQGVLA